MTIFFLSSKPAITIYINDGMQKQPAFFELLKVIFCKIEDEKNIPHPLEFYTTSKERSNPDGQLTVQKRISSIFERVKKTPRSNFRRERHH
jgi:type I restriction enzyme M protein